MKKEVPPSHSSTDTRDENNYFQDSNAVKIDNYEFVCIGSPLIDFRNEQNKLKLKEQKLCLKQKKLKLMEQELHFKLRKEKLKEKKQRRKHKNILFYVFLTQFILSFLICAIFLVISFCENGFKIDSLKAIALIFGLYNVFSGFLVKNFARKYKGKYYTFAELMRSFIEFFKNNKSK